MIGKITNGINNKCYIGKTYKSIEERYKEHLRDSSRFPDRALYRAINKYGKENFSVELLGVYEESLLEAQEIEFIHYYKSFREGYNSTEGGDQGRYLKVSDNEVIDTFKKLGNITKTALNLSIDNATVTKILQSYRIPYNAKPVIGNRKIKIVSLNKEFHSLKECARFLQKEGYSTAKRTSGTASHIRDVADGKRKSAYKLFFEWI